MHERDRNNKHKNVELFLTAYHIVIIFWKCKIGYTEYYDYEWD